MKDFFKECKRGEKGYPICERCGQETRTWTMSMFNTQHICLECEKKEREHPLYAQANEAVHNQEMAGNRNYEGIGLPDDLACN